MDRLGTVTLWNAVTRTFYESGRAQRRLSLEISILFGRLFGQDRTNEKTKLARLDEEGHRLIELMRAVDHQARRMQSTEA